MGSADRQSAGDWNGVGRTTRDVRAHDLTAARTHRIIRICERQGVPILADLAYQGGGPWVSTGIKRRPPQELTLTEKTVNRGSSRQNTGHLPDQIVALTARSAFERQFQAPFSHPVPIPAHPYRALLPPMAHRDTSHVRTPIGSPP